MYQDDNVELYRRTLKKWGEQAQFDQVIEECSELTTALLHYRRDKADASVVIDEMADVILMLGQLRWMFGPEEVEHALNRKRAKLEYLLLRENDAPQGVAE
ncbi:MAG: antitoxin [Desulfuromonadaceae bacterium]